MVVSEIIAKAEAIVEEKYTVTTWRLFIGSVLDDLASAAKILATKAGISVSLIGGNGEITLSSDADLQNAIEVVSVSFTPTGKRAKPLRKLSPNDRVSTGWRRQENKIVLQSIPWSGAVSVDYYKKLTLTLSGTEYVLNLPEQYHEVVLKGTIAVAMQKEEELDRKADFFGEYMMGKQKMAAERIFEMEPWNSQHVLNQKLGLGR